MNCKELERKRREKMEPWLLDLQEYADYCTFWIFSVNYPWAHPNTPKNMRGCMLLTADGFSMVRFRVLDIDGEKRFKLVQRSFRLMPFYGRKTPKPSDSGLVLRAMQDSVWHQSWDTPLTIEQMKQFMKWVGAISCSHLKTAARIIRRDGEQFERGMKFLCNGAAWTVQEMHGLVSTGDTKKTEKTA
jgi:hypothetical protein